MLGQTASLALRCDGGTKIKARELYQVLVIRSRVLK